jgi:hypothetical protein
MFEMSGYAFMPEDRIGTVFERAARIGDSHEQLHAPVLKQGSVLRPSILGDAYNMPSVTAEVTVHPYPQSIVIGLNLDPGVAEFVGRPIQGWDGHDAISTFGDADSTEAGYSGFEAVIHQDGTAAFIAVGESGSRRLLTGVTHDEVYSFAGTCIGAVSYHRSKQNRAALSATEAELYP